MEFQIVPKQEIIPGYAQDTLAIRSIEYFSTGKCFEKAQITPAVLAKMMENIRKGVDGIYLSLDSDNESDWMEVVSDGEWIFLSCCFDTTEKEDDDFEYYFCYNSDYADTADLLDEADFSDEAIYTSMDSGGQSPIPKIQAIRDMDAGLKAVEYFIHTGKPYPGIDWLRE